MVKDVRSMLKEVITYIIIISIIGATTIIFFNKKYVLAFLIGSLMAIFSFTINCFTTSKILTVSLNKSMLILSSFIRIALVCIVGAFIAKNNMNQILPYMIGYSTEFLAMLFYGVFLKKEI